MSKAVIFWVVAIVIAILGSVLVLAFGNQDQKEGIFKIGRQIKTNFCTDEQHVRSRYACGDLGRCWSWCHDEKTLAKTLGRADGKWCYTSKFSFFSFTGKSCQIDLQCSDKTECVTECSSGCWKSSESQLTGQTKDKRQKQQKKKDQDQF